MGVSHVVWQNSYGVEREVSVHLLAALVKPGSASLRGKDKGPATKIDPKAGDILVPRGQGCELGLRMEGICAGK